jgi:hypothetical protein
MRENHTRARRFGLVCPLFQVESKAGTQSARLLLKAVDSIDEKHKVRGLLPKQLQKNYDTYS